MIADRRVKIVATIGPATASYDNLKKAVEAGMNVARLNFSHGDHASHQEVLDNIRKVSKEVKAPITILQDLQGPKIRVGRFAEGSIQMLANQEVIISPALSVGRLANDDDAQGVSAYIAADFAELPRSCAPGSQILLDDGLMELKVIKVEGEEVRAKVIVGGELKERKGMNLPGAQLAVDPMTVKDLEDLEFGLKNRVDYIALSFVRYASDINKLREIINSQRPETRIIAKIEMREAIENLEGIVRASDAIMVARGDLAVEVGQTQLPITQKRIIKMCNSLGKPVITATQMLDSMVVNPRPTRAEVTDIANAVLDGTDALMLSAESASGKYPFECIRTMHEISLEVEQTSDIFYKFRPDSVADSTPEAIAASASYSAKKLGAAAIVCLTTTGKTATLISRFRPKSRLIAVTHIMDTLNRLELVWGIQTFSINPYQSSDDAIAQIEELLLKYGLVTKGDKIIFTLGVPVKQGSKTNSIRVFNVTGSASPLDSQSLPLRCR